MRCRGEDERRLASSRGESRVRREYRDFLDTQTLFPRGVPCSAFSLFVPHNLNCADRGPTNRMTGVPGLGMPPRSDKAKSLMNKDAQSSFLSHLAIMPPSTTMLVPLTKSLALLARKMTAPRRSLGSPHLPDGLRLRMYSLKPLYFGSVSYCVVKAVLK